MSSDHDGAGGRSPGGTAAFRASEGEGLLAAGSPVLPHHPPRTSKKQVSDARHVTYAITLVLAWYCMSTSLSLYNKKVIGHKYGVLDGEPFPAPMLMSAAQFALHWALWQRTVLPNGVATGLDIAFSNTSFAFITLSFYTMCKSSAPLFLLLFACLWGVERLTWSLGVTIGIISVGLLLLAAGEVQFDLLGFVLVMTAACMSGLRWTITQVLLQGGEGGDGAHVASGTALEIMEAVTPVMAVTSGVVSVAFEPLAGALRTSVYFSSAWHVAITCGLVGASAVLAFFMVWVEFALIATTSALTFMVAGVFKEIVTIVVAYFVFGDEFTPLNGVGLAILMAGVVLFNYQKYKKLQAARVATGGASECDTELTAREALLDGAGRACAAHESTELLKDLSEGYSNRHSGSEAAAPRAGRRGGTPEGGDGAGRCSGEEDDEHEA